jgi:hypothetical protein
LFNLPFPLLWGARGTEARASCIIYTFDLYSQSCLTCFSKGYFNLNKVWFCQTLWNYFSCTFPSDRKANPQIIILLWFYCCIGHEPVLFNLKLYSDFYTLNVPGTSFTI